MFKRIKWSTKMSTTRGEGVIHSNRSCRSFYMSCFPPQIQRTSPPKKYWINHHLRIFVYTKKDRYTLQVEHVGVFDYFSSLSLLLEACKESYCSTSISHPNFVLYSLEVPEKTWNTRIITSWHQLHPHKLHVK